MNNEATVEILISEIVDVFEPLKVGLNSIDAFSLFMSNLGWNIDGIIPDQLSSIGVILEKFDSWNNGDVELEEIEVTIGDARTIFNTIIRIESGTIDLFTQPELNNQFKEEFPRQLIDYLVVTYLLNKRSIVGNFLKLLGIIRFEKTDAIGFRPAYIKKNILWDGVSRLINDEDKFSIIKETYLWGQTDFNIKLLLDSVSKMFASLGVRTYYRSVNPDIFTFLSSGAIYSDRIDQSKLDLPLTGNVIQPNNHEIGLSILGIPETAEAKPGFAVLPYAFASVNTETTVYEHLVLKIRGGVDLTGGVVAMFRPDKSIEFVADIIPFVESTNTLSTSGNIELILESKSPNEELALIFGSKEGSHLGYKEIGFSLFLGLESGEFACAVEAIVDEFTLVIDSGEGDGFIQKILSGIKLESISDLAIGISSTEGFYFRGSSGLTITIPIHRSLGPILIENIIIGVGLSDEIDIILASSFSGKLGPISFAVNRMGLEIPISFPEDQNGNLGPIDIHRPDFLPPTGVGLSINTSGLSGGGFLDIDKVNKRYAGILALKFTKFNITAIGLITTQMPDGSDGFSLVLSMNVSFAKCITMSFGFQICSIGGIIGVNRYADTNFLRDGLRAGTLDYILFPENPIQNASSIISAMRSAFPPLDGKYLIAPCVEIKWGTGQLMANLCVMLEFPDPLRIIILGQIKLVAPNQGPKAIDINLDVLGVMDFGRKTIAIDAALFASKIQGIPISGDAAFRLNYGDNPNFALSIGGFHPKFTAPVGFPDLRRITISIIDSSNLEISCRIYTALSSNSFQVGMKITLEAHYSGIELDGNLEFDALYYFSPFYFVASMEASASVKVGGRSLASVGLDLELSGPKPWNANGFAEFSICRIEKRVRFDKTFGGGSRVSLPPVDPWPYLKVDLENEGSWGISVFSVYKYESFAEIDDDDDDSIFLHPAGLLEVREKTLPLNKSLDLYANSPISGPNHFSLSGDEIQIYSEDELEDLGSIRISYIKAHFARAQYFAISKSQKLSKPSFEKMDGGIIANDDIFDLPVDPADSEQLDFEYSEIEYENILIDSDRVSQPRVYSNLPTQYAEYDIRNEPIIAGSHGVISPFMRQAIKEGVTVEEEKYLVVDTETMDIMSQVVSIEGEVQNEADQILAQYLEDNPQDNGKFQVVSAYELENV